eukprot:6492656-Amphidinium_carterae.6
MMDPSGQSHAHETGFDWTQLSYTRVVVAVELYSRSSDMVYVHQCRLAVAAVVVTSCNIPGVEWPMTFEEIGNGCKDCKDPRISDCEVDVRL